MITQEQVVNAGAGLSSRIPQESNSGDTRGNPAALPFEEAFAPYRSYVRPRLQAVSLWISETAARDLEDEIIFWLSRACAQTLLAEFSARRPDSLILAAKLFDHIEKPERDLYRKFIRDLRRDGWNRLRGQYPVLARLVDGIVRLKLEEAVEFSSRLETDWPHLREHFAIGPSAVRRIRSGLSDPHQGMRSVKVLEFDSGDRLVYKPKNIELQTAWSELSRWAGERTGLDLAAPKVFDRSTHGWMEFVRHEPCLDEAGVRRYYRRAGALVCLLYAIRGSDCHFENLLASGEYPMLIDTETLMQPDFEIGGQALSAASPEFLARYLAESVIQSGMLPSWETLDENQPVNAGGLGCADGVSATRPGWRYTNTDYMYFGELERVERRHTNIPVLGGRHVSAAGYLDEIIAGFEQTYRALLEHRGELLSDCGPLAIFRGRPVRFVLRNTRIYQMMIELALHPEYLRDEKSFRGCLNEMIPLLPAWALAIDPKPIWDAEVAALTSLDVPMFTVLSDSKKLFTDCGEAIEGCMRRSGHEAVIDQIGNLGEEDLRRQVALIRLSFRALSAHEARTDGDSGGWMPGDWSPGAAVQEARRLGDFLLDTAIHGNHGETGWVALNHLPTIDRHTIAPLDHGLWGGTCGIGLYFAALYRISGDERHKGASLSAFLKTRRAISQRFSAWGIGGEKGLGGILYSLARAGEWLDDSSLIADACRAAGMIDPKLIAADSEFDVLGGAAGCLLGLVALHEVAPSFDVRYRAALCTTHLISHQEPQPEGGAAWKGQAPKPATGFAHGAAGIAYALARWNKRNPERDLEVAIRQALVYEQSQYSEQDENWFDARSLGDPRLPRFGSSWCHGAPGIGLGRTGLLPVIADGGIRADIDAALRFVERSESPQTDTLCCGRLGWIDLLISASDALERPELRDLANRRAAGMIERARRDGGYRLLSGEPDDAANPTLFAGIAGIGFELLRLAHPTRLPSVLLFQ